MDFNDIKKKLSKIYVASVKLGRLIYNDKDFLKDKSKGESNNWDIESIESLNKLSEVSRDGEILRNCDADIADLNEAKKLISSKSSSKIVNKYYDLAKKESDFKHLTELGDKFADSDIKLLKDLTGKVNFSRINLYNSYIKNFSKDNVVSKSKIQNITNILTQYVPENWSEVHLEVKSVGNKYNITTWAINPNRHGFHLDDKDINELSSILDTVKHPKLGSEWNELDLVSKSDGDYNINLK